MGLLAKQEQKEISLTDPELRKQAEVMVKSGLMPKEIDTPEKVISVGVYGRAHGISFEEATIGGDVYVFQGKAGKLLMMVKSERKLEQMMSSISGFHYDILKDSSDKLHVIFHRLMNGFPVKVEMELSTSDSDIKHLMSKENWKYSKNMLWNTACRRLGNKWPDWKRMNNVPDFADLPQAEQAMEDLTGEEVVHTTQEGEDINVNTFTGEVVDADIVEEETVEAEQEQEEPKKEEPKASKPVIKKAEKINPDKDGNYSCDTPGCENKIPEAAYKFSKRAFNGRSLCFTCQNDPKITGEE